MELLQQVRVIDPTQGIDRLRDVLIIEGKIKAIATQITDYPQETQIITGDDLILGTGLVDLYSHSGEPGNEARETLFDLAQAAAAGGFTQVGILPDTVPPIDNSEVLAAITQKSSYLKIVLSIDKERFSINRYQIFDRCIGEQVGDANVEDREKD